MRIELSELTTDREKALGKRIEALEQLLAHYRTGGHPSDALLDRLDRTRRHLAFCDQDKP